MADVKTYKAVVLTAPGKPQLLDLPMPELTPTQVLVKVAYAQINPSDLACMQYGFFYGRQTGAVMGFDGSGTVVKLGEKVPKEFLNAQVCCGYSAGSDSGSWSEYFIGDYWTFLQVKEKISLEDSCALVVNPFTVVGMIDKYIQRQGLKSTAIYPASSQLGRQLVKYTAKLGIETIPIVRSAARAKQATEEWGMKNVLAYDEPDFESKFKELSAKLEIKVAFESVAGSATARLLKAMPYDSTVVNFGVLESPEISGIQALPLLVDQKTVTGFLLFNYVKEMKEKANEKFHEGVQKNYEECFNLGPREVFELKDWLKAVDVAKSMTTGKKVLLKLN